MALLFFFKEECVPEISKGSKLEIRPITYEEQVGKRLIKLEDKNECFADRTHEGTPRGTN